MPLDVLRQLKEIAELQAANTQSQKMLDEAGKTEQQQKATIELLKQDQRVYKEAYDKQDGENALLKEALDNYKQADLARDYGKGHEME